MAPITPIIVPKSYTVSQREADLATTWFHKHTRKHHPNVRFHSYRIAFTETGIGVHIDILCLGTNPKTGKDCKGHKDITDYDSW
jgi:hypothetical protein